MNQFDSLNRLLAHSMESVAFLELSTVDFP
jgi:hypothetical protein